MRAAFHHVHLICSDLEESIRFFTGILGATLVVRKQFGPVDGAILDQGGVLVYLRLPRPGEELDSQPALRRLGYDHIGVAVDDLYTAYEELAGKGVVFSIPPASRDARVAFFKGPDNIDVELYQPD